MTTCRKDPIKESFHPCAITRVVTWYFFLEPRFIKAVFKSKVDETKIKICYWLVKVNCSHASWAVIKGCKEFLRSKVHMLD